MKIIILLSPFTMQSLLSIKRRDDELSGTHSFERPTKRQARVVMHSSSMLPGEYNPADIAMQRTRGREVQPNQMRTYYQSGGDLTRVRTQPKGQAPTVVGLRGRGAAGVDADDADYINNQILLSCPQAYALQAGARSSRHNFLPPPASGPNRFGATNTSITNRVLLALGEVPITDFSDHDRMLSLSNLEYDSQASNPLSWTFAEKIYEGVGAGSAGQVVSSRAVRNAADVAQQKEELRADLGVKAADVQRKREEAVLNLSHKGTAADHFAGASHVDASNIFQAHNQSIALNQAHANAIYQHDARQMADADADGGNNGGVDKDAHKDLDQREQYVGGGGGGDPDGDGEQVPIDLSAAMTMGRVSAEDATFGPDDDEPADPGEIGLYYQSSDYIKPTEDGISAVQAHASAAAQTDWRKKPAWMSDAYWAHLQKTHPKATRDMKKLRKGKTITDLQQLIEDQTKQGTLARGAFDV